MKRTSYQSGSVQRKVRKRGPDVWVFRYMDDGVQKAEALGTIDQFRTKAAAQREAAKLREKINERIASIRIAGLCDRFEKEYSEVRPKTLATYLGFLKRVRAELGDHRVDELGRDPVAMESWVNAMASIATEKRPSRPLSKKTKLHYKAFLHLLFEFAMKQQVFPLQRNPATLIKVRGHRKRIRHITLLTSEQYRTLISDPELGQHIKAMIQVAMLLGLRISEVLGLKWKDIDFAEETITIQRSSVGQHVDETKTPESFATLPMHQELAAVIEQWRKDEKPINGWVFGSIITGRPYWQGTLQQDHLIPAGKKIGVQSLGWHDFRHTYRAMMGELEIPAEMQQTLMRHADISTTLSYGGKPGAHKTRKFNTQVVEMLRA